MSQDAFETAGFDTSIPAVVFKLDPNVLHHGGLGLIRSLGRAGVPMFAVHEDSLAPAAHSRYLRGRWLWRPNPQDTEQIMEGLEQLARRLGWGAVLFPTDDAAAIFLAEHRAVLRQWFRFPDPPADLPRRVAGKFSMYRLCRQLGVPCAETRLVGSARDAREFADEVGFPVVAKLATPWLRAGKGVRSTMIVRSSEELATLFDDNEEPIAGELLLQEYLPGGRGHDWFFHGYCDAESRCLVGFTGIKERSYPAHAGLTSLGRSAENATLREEAADLLQRLGFRGIVDLDYRLDERDGRYKLLDFNPRLGAQFRLFTDSAGLDVVRAAYLDLTGQAVIPGDPVQDRRFVVESHDPLAALRYASRGELGPLRWARSLRAVDEKAWWSRDDLVPFALMCVWMAARMVSRPLRRRVRPVELARPEYGPGRARFRPTGRAVESALRPVGRGGQ